MTRRRSVAFLLAGLSAAAPSCGGTTDRPPARIVYVALGDSTGFGIGSLTFEGYPHRLARRIREAGREVELVNLSVPGATAGDVASLQSPNAARLRPGLVTIGIGANDVGRGRTREEFAADLARIAADVAGLGAPVVIANVPDLTLTPARAAEPPSYGQLLAALNDEIAAAAARNGFALVDLHAASRTRILARPELIAPDGFHPSDAGYEEWAEVMWPVVRASLGIR